MQRGPLSGSPLQMRNACSQRWERRNCSVVCPTVLTEILESQQHGRPLTGVQVAQAAIATYHSGALREYRHTLEHLDPPSQWAGRGPAVDFVRSLGFSEEWAGDRNTRRPPYIEVHGPTTLPPLHDYQRVVVGNIRELLKSKLWANDRRGMISMPTGSGENPRRRAGDSRSPSGKTA